MFGAMKRDDRADEMSMYACEEEDRGEIRTQDCVYDWIRRGGVAGKARVQDYQLGVVCEIRRRCMLLIDE